MTSAIKDRAIRRWLNGATEREVAEQASRSGRPVTPEEVRASLREEGFHPVEPPGSPWRAIARTPHLFARRTPR